MVGIVIGAALVYPTVQGPALQSGFEQQIKVQLRRLAFRIARV